MRCGGRTVQSGNTLAWALVWALVWACALVACSSQSPPDTGKPPVDPAVVEPEKPEDDAGTAAPDKKACTQPPPNAGSFLQKKTSAAGAARSYHLGVPARSKIGERLPLLVVLHGAGNNNPSAMREWFSVESKLPSVLAVYPQALARTRADGSGGNVSRWDLAGKQDLAFFDVILAELADAYCIDRAHVFVTGFSSGGNFSQHLACQRQADVKGMAVVAGPGPFSNTCGGAVPVWMTHDTGDTVLPVADARESRDFWAKANGCSATSWAPVAGRPGCTQNPSCPAKAPVVYCESSGVGHAVAGFAIDAIGGFFGELLK